VRRARRPRVLAVVVLLVAILAFYFVLLAARAVSLLRDPRLTVQGLGLGILLLPLVGLVIVGHELRFGRSAQRLGERLADEQHVEEPPPADVADADAAFDRRRAEVQAAPDDWRAWYRLGVAYGDAGDVARGRRAVRRAIALEQRSARPGPAD
jgi:cytochrome c-type biogenesis protein CcmH/NrfG